MTAQLHVLIPALWSLGDSLVSDRWRTHSNRSLSQRTIDSNAFAEIAASAKRALTTVTELERAIDRSRPGLFDDATILCLCEADPTLELRAIDCPKCGYQWLSIGTHAESR